MFTFEDRQAGNVCPCDAGLTCSPRMFATYGGPPYTTSTRDFLKAMLDAIVAVLQDQALMGEYEKWKFVNPWVGQDRGESGFPLTLYLNSVGLS